MKAKKSGRGTWRDLTGMTFGLLTVLEIAPSVKKPGKTIGRWLCRCCCGNSTVVTTSSLTSGHTKSCGCLHAQLVTTHGHSRGRNHTYSSWRAMKDRCNNPSDKDYSRYGAIGITVCERWNHYEHFLEDMGERPPRTSIDRIDSTGDYKPGNCRWATPNEQARNRSSTIITEQIAKEIRESSKPQKHFVEKYGISQACVSDIRTNRTWRQSPVSRGEIFEAEVA